MTIVKLFNTLKAQGIELTEKDGQLNIKAPKGTLTAQLKATLKENKEELLAFLRDIQTSHECAPIQAHIRAKDDVNHPLSFSQKRLWLTDKLKGSSAEYNIPKVFKISGVLDLGLIKQVFESILTRHEVLRTVYVDVDGEAMQRIRPMSEVEFDIQVEDVRALSTAEQEEAVRARVTADIEQAFDLAEDVMLRVGYIHTSDSSGVLLFNMHHIASDGWSMEVLNKEFFTLYEAYSQNQANPLPEL
ncbi:condensation domain-containing protein, partial [Pseudoalteromonas sp. JW3]